MSVVLTSLNAASLNGPGEIFELDKPRKSFGMQYTVVGSPGGNIHLEGSLDGVNFFPLFSAALSTGTFAIAVSTLLTTFLRASLSDMTVSASTTAIIAVEE